MIFCTGSIDWLGIEAPDKSGGVRGLRGRRSRCGGGREKYPADCEREDDDDDDDDDGIDDRRGVKSGKSREKRGPWCLKSLN